MCSGRKFQVWAAATGKARLPTVASLARGTTRRLVPAERRALRPGTSIVEVSGPRYCGALDFRRHQPCFSRTKLWHNIQTLLELLRSDKSTMYPAIPNDKQLTSTNYLAFDLWPKISKYKMSNFRNSSSAKCFKDYSLQYKTFIATLKDLYHFSFIQMQSLNLH